MSVRDSRNLLFVSAAVINELDQKGYNLSDTIHENGDIVLNYDAWKSKLMIESDMPLLLKLGSIVKIDYEVYEITIRPERRYPV
jgi:hypothetical protein